MRPSNSSHPGVPGRILALSSTVVMALLCTHPPRREGARLRLVPNPRAGPRGTMVGNDHDCRATPCPPQARLRCPACDPCAGPSPRLDGPAMRSICSTCASVEKSAHPLVFIPGGPGAASIALYRGGLRKRAVAAGVDVIMVEHRGVGLSRHDDQGADLPAGGADGRGHRGRSRRRTRRRRGLTPSGPLRHVLRHLSGRRRRRATSTVGCTR